MLTCFVALFCTALTGCQGGKGVPPPARSPDTLNPLIPSFYHSTDDILQRFETLSKGGCGKGVSVTLDKHGDSPALISALFKTTTGDKQKKKVFFLFGEHARELISPETALQMAEDLCMLHENSKIWAQTVLGHSEIFMIPIANPLGRYSVERGNTCQRVNENGVDLNRNWESHWEADEASYGSDVYPGKQAFSEPETKTLKAIVDKYAPSMFVTVHSGTLGMYTPYAYSTDVPHDDPSDLGNMVKITDKLNPEYCECPSGPAGKEVGYLCPGTCLDYAYDKTKTKYSFAFEIYSKDAEDIHDQYHQSHSHSLLETGNGHAHGHHHHHHPEYSCFIQASEESSHSLLNRLTPEECVPYFNPITKSEYEKVKTKWSEAFLKMIDMAHGAQENGPPTREMVSSPAKAAIESMLRGNAVKTKGA